MKAGEDDVLRKQRLHAEDIVIAAANLDAFVFEPPLTTPGRCGHRSTVVTWVAARLLQSGPRAKEQRSFEGPYPHYLQRPDNRSSSSLYSQLGRLTTR